MKYWSFLVILCILTSGCAVWKDLNTPPPGVEYYAPNTVDLGVFGVPLIPGMMEGYDWIPHYTVRDRRIHLGEGGCVLITPEGNIYIKDK